MEENMGDTQTINNLHSSKLLERFLLMFTRISLYSSAFVCFSFRLIEYNNNFKSILFICQLLSFYLIYKEYVNVDKIDPEIKITVKN